MSARGARQGAAQMNEYRQRRFRRREKGAAGILASSASSEISAPQGEWSAAAVKRLSAITTPFRERLHPTIRDRYATGAASAIEVMAAEMHQYGWEVAGAEPARNSDDQPLLETGGAALVKRIPAAAANVPVAPVAAGSHTGVDADEAGWTAPPATSAYPAGNTNGDTGQGDGDGAAGGGGPGGGSSAWTDLSAGEEESVDAAAVPTAVLNQEMPSAVPQIPTIAVQPFLVSPMMLQAAAGQGLQAVRPQRRKLRAYDEAHSYAGPTMKTAGSSRAAFGRDKGHVHDLQAIDEQQGSDSRSSDSSTPSSGALQRGRRRDRLLAAKSPRAWAKRSSRAEKLGVDTAKSATNHDSASSSGIISPTATIISIAPPVASHHNLANKQSLPALHRRKPKRPMGLAGLLVEPDGDAASGAGNDHDTGVGSGAGLGRSTGSAAASTLGRKPTRLSPLALNARSKPLHSAAANSSTVTLAKATHARVLDSASAASDHDEQWATHVPVPPGLHDTSTALPAPQRASPSNRGGDHVVASVPTIDVDPDDRDHDGPDVAATPVSPDDTTSSVATSVPWAYLVATAARDSDAAASASEAAAYATSLLEQALAADAPVVAVQSAASPSHAHASGQRRNSLSVMMGSARFRLPALLGSAAKAGNEPHSAPRHVSMPPRPDGPLLDGAAPAAGVVQQLVKRLAGLGKPASRVMPALDEGFVSRPAALRAGDYRVALPDHASDEVPTRQQEVHSDVGDAQEPASTTPDQHDIHHHRASMPALNSLATASTLRSLMSVPSIVSVPSTANSSIAHGGSSSGSAVDAYVIHTGRQLDNEAVRYLDGGVVVAPRGRHGSLDPRQPGTMHAAAKSARRPAQAWGADQRQASINTSPAKPNDDIDADVAPVQLSRSRLPPSVPALNHAHAAAAAVAEAENLPGQDSSLQPVISVTRVGSRTATDRLFDASALPAPGRKHAFGSVAGTSVATRRVMMDADDVGNGFQAREANAATVELDGHYPDERVLSLESMASTQSAVPAAGRLPHSGASIRRLDPFRDPSAPDESFMPGSSLSSFTGHAGSSSASLTSLNDKHLADHTVLDGGIVVRRNPRTTAGAVNVIGHGTTGAVVQPHAQAVFLLSPLQASSDDRQQTESGSTSKHRGVLEPSASRSQSTQESANAAAVASSSSSGSWAAPTAASSAASTSARLRVARTHQPPLLPPTRANRIRGVDEWANSAAERMYAAHSQNSVNAATQRFAGVIDDVHDDTDVDRLG